MPNKHIPLLPASPDRRTSARVILQYEVAYSGLRHLPAAPLGSNLDCLLPVFIQGPALLQRPQSGGHSPQPLDLYPFLTLRNFLVQFSRHLTWLSLWSREPLGFQLPLPQRPLPLGNLGRAV